MRLRFMLISFIWIHLCLNAYADQDRMRFLTAPAVSWNDDRLSGKLNNIPISSLLEDLIKSKHFDCVVQGQMKGSISITFEKLTVEEVIHKIMRSKNYSYTLLSRPGSVADDHYPGIEKLTIYRDDSIISFSSVPRATRKARMPNTATRHHTPPPEKKSPVQQTNTADQHGKEIKRLDQEIKGFLDEMLASKEMNKEEYESALAEIKATAGPN